jgi:hypothetical protein
MTTGVPVSSSRAQTASSSGSRGSNEPTWTCTLNTRAPRSSASVTYPVAPGSGKNVADCSTRRSRRANSADHSLSHAAMPGLCGYGSVGKARTPSRSRTASRSSTGSS